MISAISNLAPAQPVAQTAPATHTSSQAAPQPSADTVQISNTPKLFCRKHWRLRCRLRRKPEAVILRPCTFWLSKRLPKRRSKASISLHVSFDKLLTAEIAE